MSSLQDPFDLLDTKKMDNVVPFLAATKINSMIDQAVVYPQLAHLEKNVVPARTVATKRPWQIAGVGIAACLALFLTLFSDTNLPVFDLSTPQHQGEVHMALPSLEDVAELNEMMILDTLDRY